MSLYSFIPKVPGAMSFFVEAGGLEEARWLVEKHINDSANQYAPADYAGFREGGYRASWTPPKRVITGGREG